MLRETHDGLKVILPLRVFGLGVPLASLWPAVIGPYNLPGISAVRFQNAIFRLRLVVPHILDCDSQVAWCGSCKVLRQVS
jgi:hypothetical protein